MELKKGFYEKYCKRPQDAVLALIALIVLLVPLCILAYKVKSKLGSPILFRQTRTGINGRLFTIYKFKTMTDERDAQGRLLPDSLRLTKFGKWLRSTSLDELPELYNIMIGDMSIVGPRPLLPEYLNRYSDEQNRRHEVRPGLSGLAQISGRNAISWEERFKLDVKYLENISFTKDWKIILLTIKKVLIREGISADGCDTMEEFKG